MTTQEQKALELALECAERCNAIDGMYDWTETITTIKKILAQPDRHELQAKGEHPAPCARFCEVNAFKIEIRNLKAQLAQQSNEQVELIKFPRNVQEYAEDWIIDPAFISRVKHSIDPETPWDFTPTMEQVEATLLALEVIPSTLFAHPPVPTAQPKEPEQEPVACVIEAKSLGAVALKLTKELPIGTQLYTTPPQRKPLTLEQLREHWQVAKVLDMTDAEIDFADYVLITRDIEALHGIKE